MGTAGKAPHTQPSSLNQNQSPETQIHQPTPKPYPTSLYPIPLHDYNQFMLAHQTTSPTNLYPPLFYLQEF